MVLVGKKLPKPSEKLRKKPYMSIDKKPPKLNEKIKKKTRRVNQ